ncbi:MAG: galactokinase [Actinomycetia bacterium]|nr:galactokinase [Actinomycetes bacterium]
MGDHTDYAEGFALPVAIDLETRVTFRPTRDGRVRVRSAGFESEVDVSADGTVDPAAVDPAWGRLIGGVVRTLAVRGRPAVGIDATVSSTVPTGSGLSSSAALSVSTALALLDAAGWTMPAAELAVACQEAERLGTGVPSGIMDQLASIRGVAGNALLLDCRTLTVEPVPLPSAYAIVVVHSGLPRALAESAYAERHAAATGAAARLGLAALRDATSDQVADDPIARHVVSENERVLATADALLRGDVGALKPLFAASHASLRDDFRVSTPELDLLVELLVELGAVGARLTGAGFGGCVVALVQRNRADDLTAKVARAYSAKTGLEPRAFVVRAVDGAGPA